MSCLVIRIAVPKRFRDRADAAYVAGHRIESHRRLIPEKHDWAVQHGLADLQAPDRPARCSLGVQGELLLFPQRKLGAA